EATSMMFRSGPIAGLMVLSGLCGVGAFAQTVRIDTTPARLIKFDPDVALGSSMDILPADLTDVVYSEPLVKEALSAGWGPITYRQNTELTVAARSEERRVGKDWR